MTVLESQPGINTVKRLRALFDLIADHGELLPEFRKSLREVELFFLLENQPSEPAAEAKIATLWFQPGRQGLKQVTAFLVHDEAERFCALQQQRFRVAALGFDDIMESLAGYENEFGYTFFFPGMQMLQISSATMHAISSDSHSFDFETAPTESSRFSNLNFCEQTAEIRKEYSDLLSSLRNRLAQESNVISAYLLELEDQIDSNPVLLLLVNCVDPSDNQSTPLYTDLLFILSNSELLAAYQSREVCFIDSREDAILRKKGLSDFLSP